MVAEGGWWPKEVDSGREVGGPRDVKGQKEDWPKEVSGRKDVEGQKEDWRKGR